VESGWLGPASVLIGGPRNRSTNVHSGQLDWQTIGTARAAACGADPAMVVNTWPVDELLAWAARGAE
jgi:hypothetical protein